MYSTYDNFCDPFPVGTKIPGNSYYNGSLFRGGICHGTTVPLTSWGVQGKLVVGITDQIDVSAIAGYRKMDTFFGAAWDGTIFNDSLIYHEDHTWNWNGELRLTGKHDWIDWNAGLFYYKGYASENGEPQNVRVGTQQYQYVYYHPEAKAAYLNVTVRPFSRLSLNGGVRRSDDKKFVDYSALQDASAPGSTTFKPSGTSTIFTLPIRNKRWDWKLGANYDFSEHGMVYVSAATGYRLPTFNTRVFQNGQAQQNSDEALTNYEVGVKVDLFDRKLRINADAFLIKFQERPASFGGMEPRFASDGMTVLAGNQTVIPDGPANSAFSNAFTNCRAYNATTDGPPDIAKGVGVTCVSRSFAYTVTGSNFKGLEAEVTLTPIRNLVITGSMGYTDRGSDTGRPLNFPDWTASGGIQYTIDADFLGGTITPRLDWFYASSIAYNTNTPEYDQPANSTFNGRISYRNREYDFDLSVGATNLFNKKYYLQKTIFTAIGAEANIGQPAAPREWYLNLTKRF
jgi:iron complex outermembrane receptor protein